MDFNAAVAPDALLVIGQLSVLRNNAMKLGYRYFRNSLIKLGILGIAMPFILWDFFTRKDSKSEPGAIYLLIFIWVGGTAFLVWQMVRAKRREREARMVAEENRGANRSQPIRSEKNPSSSAVDRHR